MPDSGRRLNGWKAIGSYFGRDRTTAIRWARERNLPVHRTPGGKISTVYAFTGDLDRWLGGIPDANQAEPVSPQSLKPTPRRKIATILAGIVAALLVLGLATTLYLRFNYQKRVPSRTLPMLDLPADKETAAIFLQARQNWAQRSSKSIDEAISGFGNVIGRDPSFAPAYAGLADAYILAREFGSLPDAVAFPKAKAAATVALKLAPDLAAAHRALGFVHYWWDHDEREAGIEFRRALTLAPDDSQSHHWYGTALTDNGDFSAALRELNAARGLNPESVAIQSDWGFALWATGKRAAAISLLVRLARENPKLAAPHDCLRYIYLGERDFARYLAEMLALADLRGEPDLKAQAEEEYATFQKGGAVALKPLMVRNALLGRRPQTADQSWAATVASAAGDRSTLVTLLRDADSRGEKWGSAAQLVHMVAAWPNDAEISTLVARRWSSAMEP